MIPSTVIIEPCDSAIKIVVGYVLNNQPIVLYATCLDNNGLILNGTILKLPEFVDLIKEKVVHFVDPLCKVKFTISNAVVILPPTGFEVFEDKKTIPVTSSQGRIEILDYNIVSGMMCKAFQGLKTNNSIIDIKPLFYYIDNYKTKTLPLGQTSSMFGMKGLIYTLPTMLNKAYIASFKTANITIVKTVIAPTAIAHLFENDKQIPDVYIFVDVGANYTSISVISKAYVYNSSCFLVGGNELTKRIANEFLIDYKYAEKIKKKYGYNNREISFDPIIVNSTSLDGQELTFTVKDLNKVCEDYLESYAYSFNMCLDKLLSNYPEERRNFPIIFGGGGSRLDGFISYMKEKYPDKNISKVPLKVIGGRHEKYLNCIGALIAYEKDKGDNNNKTNSNVNTQNKENTL